jgi:two-component system CheB/CheR fusion protein
MPGLRRNRGRFESDEAARPWRATGLPAPERMAAALLERLPDAVVACDADGRIVASNAAAQEILGARGARVPAGEWSERFGLYRRDGGELLAPGELPLTVALNGREIHDLEVEIRAGDDRKVVTVSCGPLRDVDGRIEGALIVMHDVSGRVAADHELRLQATIAANIAAGVALVRASDGEILDVNSAFQRMLGYEQGELTGRHISVVTAPLGQAPEVRAQEMAHALETGGVWAGEIQNLRKDGTRFWCAANVSTFEHPDYGATWIVVQTDISERKVAEEALRVAEERFHRVFEEAPVGIALVGSDLRMTDANLVLSEITGYTRDELVGKTLADVTHPDDIELDAELNARMMKGEIPGYRINQRYVTKHGDVIAVALRSTCVRDSADRPLNCIAIVEPLAPLSEVGAIGIDR